MIGLASLAGILLLARVFRNPSRQLRRRLKYRWRMWRAEAFWRDLRVTPGPRGRLRIIATLTTSPDRIHQLRPVLESLTRGQTRPPDEIHLNVPHRFGRTGQAYEIPSFLAEYGVQVHRCDDVGPGTKFIPTLRRLRPDEDAWLLVVDDDVRHLPEAVAALERAAEADPRSAHGYADNYLYRKWQPGQPVDFLCGFAGFIFHRGFIGPDFEDYLARVLPNRDCLFHDDIYFSNYLALRGVRRFRVSVPAANLRRMERLGCLLEHGAGEGSLALGAGTGLNTHLRGLRAMEHLRSVGLAAIHSPQDAARPVAVLPRWLRPEPSGELVRMGRENDGGYVLPRAAVAEADGLLSLGINDDWSFDRAFNRLRPAAPIVGYDPTISRSRFFLKALGKALILPLAVLVKPRRSVTRCLHAWRVALDYGPFFHGPARHVSRWIGDATREGVTSLADALADPAFESSRRVVLKVDIEGAEYAAFASTPLSSLSAVTLLLVEFHDVSRHLGELEALSARLAPGFAIAHVHANNFGAVREGWPEVLEIAWVRRGICPSGGVAPPELPLAGLDRPNDSRRPDITLRFAD